MKLSPWMPGLGFKKGQTTPKVGKASALCSRITNPEHQARCSEEFDCWVCCMEVKQVGAMAELMRVVSIDLQTGPQLLESFALSRSVDWLIVWLVGCGCLVPWLGGWVVGQRSLYATDLKNSRWVLHSAEAWLKWVHALPK